jgi:hypothetical protein
VSVSLYRNTGVSLSRHAVTHDFAGALSEHLVDLCVQPLARRYPLRHGRGLLPLVA